MVNKDSLIEHNKRYESNDIFELIKSGDLSMRIDNYDFMKNNIIRN